MRDERKAADGEIEGDSRVSVAVITDASVVVGVLFGWVGAVD